METLIKELNKLEIEIRSHAKYLKEYTYYPFNKVEEFSDRLKEIIKTYGKDKI